MEERVLTAAEAAEFEEFKRCKREAQIALSLAKLLCDITGKEAHFAHAWERAQQLGAAGLLVPPILLDAAVQGRKEGMKIVCRVGGAGDGLPSVKRIEARRAARRGADELRLVPYYSFLADGNLNALRKEIRRVRTGVRRSVLCVVLDDPMLSEHSVRIGVRAARLAGADGVCVRAELPLVRAAQEEGGDKLYVAVTAPASGMQLRLMFDAGAVSASAQDAERLARELRQLYAADEENRGHTELPPQNMPLPAESR